MFGLEFTPSTVVVALIVLALVFLAVRRLVRNGLCDCHKGCLLYTSDAADD